MGLGALTPVEWIGSSKKDLCEFPDDIRGDIGHAIFIAQEGKRHESAKSLKGFGGAGVLEIIENDVSGTYRAVYTVKFLGVIYILHAFQKKSKKGIDTPKKEMDLIKKRLKKATEHYEEHKYEYQK